MNFVLLYCAYFDSMCYENRLSHTVSLDLLSGLKESHLTARSVSKRKGSNVGALLGTVEGIIQNVEAGQQSLCHCFTSHIVLQNCCTVWLYVILFHSSTCCAAGPYICAAGFLSGWSVDSELTVRLHERGVCWHGHVQTASDEFFRGFLMIICYVNLHWHWH